MNRIAQIKKVSVELLHHEAEVARLTSELEALVMPPSAAPMSTTVPMPAPTTPTKVSDATKPEKRRGRPPQTGVEVAARGRPLTKAEVAARNAKIKSAILGVLGAEPMIVTEIRRRVGLGHRLVTMGLKLLRRRKLVGTVPFSDSRGRPTQGWVKLPPTNLPRG